jgi:hypothetical protein
MGRRTLPRAFQVGVGRGFCAATIFACALARAGEPSSAEKAQALYVRAQGFLEKGDVGGARWLFAESYSLDPATGSLIYFALCDEKLGLVASARVLFREAVREAEEKRETDRASLARARADKLEPLVPQLTIVVAPSLRSGKTEVLLDEAPVEVGQWGSPIAVDPGVHEVRARGEKTISWVHAVRLESRQVVSVTVPPLEPAFPTSPPPARRAASMWIPAAWTAAGMGVAALGVGAVYGISGLVNRGTYTTEGNCLGGTADCNRTGFDAATRARSDFRVADMSYAIGGGLLVAAGAFWLLARRQGATGGYAQTRLVVLPLVSADSWMLSLDRVW